MPDESVGTWLGKLSAHMLEAQRYEYADLTDIQAWAGIAGSRPLFDSLLVVENFPVSDRAPGDVRLSGS